MNNKTKVLALGLAGLLTGCATTKPSYLYRAKHLANGYTVDNFGTEMMLKSLARRYAGTIKKRVKKGNGVYTVIRQGDYSLAKHPESMTKVCELADSNGDKFITSEEVRELYRRND